MTLHEAICEILMDCGKEMSAAEIAAEINSRRSYVKGDGSPVTRFQIHGRTRNYPKLFRQSGSSISLAEWSELAVHQAIEPNLGGESRQELRNTVDELEHQSWVEDHLLDLDRFRPAGEIDLHVPDRPGLYAIRIRDRSALPAPFVGLSEDRGHDLLYLGIARTSLKTRFLGQELRAKGHGTFFRSTGAVLGYRPSIGSLVGKANSRNFVFTPADEQSIIEWVNRNLLVNWIVLSDGHLEQERSLLRKHKPLFNILGNPAALPELLALRAECVGIANAMM